MHTTGGGDGGSVRANVDAATSGSCGTVQALHHQKNQPAGPTQYTFLGLSAHTASP